MKSNGKSRVIYVSTVLLTLNVAVLSQPPDNAALLYYQAFLLYEEPNETMDKILTGFRNGEIGSNEAITKYIEKNRRVIDLVVRAADVSQCDWGYDYSQEVMRPNLNPLKRIFGLLTAEAKWLIEQGNYVTALDRCVTMRKIALHASNEALLSWTFGNTMNSRTNVIIEDVLGLMPPDAGELDRLKSRLIQTQARFPSLVSSLVNETQLNVATMQKNRVQPLLDMYEGSLGGHLLEPMLERIPNGDDTFFKKNREYYIRAMATFIEALESGLPYTRMCIRLDELPKRWSKDAEDNPDATLTSLSLPPITGIYHSMVKQHTHLNAIMTAINLYIIKARMGQLPDSLPADSPCGLFSDEPFAYVKTTEGFYLRCQGKDKPRSQDGILEYQFKVK